MKDKRILIFTGIALALTIAVIIAWSTQEEKETDMIPIDELREKEKDVEWDEIEINEIPIDDEPALIESHRAHTKIALKEELQIFTQEKCEEYGVSYPLILALMESESTFLEAIGNERILGGEEGGPLHEGRPRDAREMGAGRQGGPRPLGLDERLGLRRFRPDLQGSWHFL